ncbi:MAG TPA: hypothetical protein VN848_13405 [Gemmatimonadales bacterium]|nr:hypothetical protein [Gemmatimonadales bacterium]
MRNLAGVVDLAPIDPAPPVLPAASVAALPTVVPPAPFDGDRNRFLPAAAAAAPQSAATAAGKPAIRIAPLGWVLGHAEISPVRDVLARARVRPRNPLQRLH